MPFLRPVRPACPGIEDQIELRRRVGTQGALVESVDHDPAQPLVELGSALLGRNDGRDGDRMDARRLSAAILHRDLRLGVGRQPARIRVAALLVESPRDAMSVADRRGHELGRLATSVAEHIGLILSDGVFYLRIVVRVGQRLPTIGRQLREARKDRAATRVEATVDIAGLGGDLARERRQIDIRLRGEAGGEKDHSRRDGAFDDRTRRGVLAEKSVDGRVADLVAELVRMAGGDGFGSEDHVRDHLDPHDFCAAARGGSVGRR
jgi:hypothetical protein